MKNLASFIFVTFVLIEGTDGKCSCDYGGNVYYPEVSSGCTKYIQYSDVTGRSLTLSCSGALIFDVGACVCNWPSATVCPANRCDPTNVTEATTEPHSTIAAVTTPENSNITANNSVTSNAPITTPMTKVNTTILPTDVPDLNRTGSSLYPYGAEHGDILHPAVDDSCELSFDLANVTIARHMNISSVYVCSNGILSFNAPYPHPGVQPFPLSFTEPSVIAPFWADIDLRYRGSLWVRVGSWATMHNGTHSGPISQDSWAIVVTWEGVEAFGSNPDSEFDKAFNTFQCILFGDMSFAAVEFRYADLQWPSTSHPGYAQMGFDLAGGYHYTLNASRTDNISDVLMHGQYSPGLWAYQLFPNANMTAP